MAFEAVIGLECHLQLNTVSKMFCGCPVQFGGEPNTAVCPVCLGLPGALPRANRAAIDAAIRLGLSLGCEIRAESVFARKHYFYPDMPKNFQISQYDRPLCEGGALPVMVGVEARTFALTRIHAEEDTGKSFHPERVHDRRLSRVDFNRAGVPLLELVSEPVLHTPEECGAFLTAFRRLVRWLGISDGDMEKGQLRCDANVSLRPVGSTMLGTKTELKNLNSIRGVERGVAAECRRQQTLLEAGERVTQATLLYDADHDHLAIMRSKEHAHDYRYFPEPDLPVLRVDAAWRADAAARTPELPWVRTGRVAREFALPEYAAAVLTETRGVADYYEALARGGDAKLASNWVMNEVLRVLNEREWDIEQWAERVPAARLKEFLEAVGSKQLPGPLAKQVFAWLPDEPGTLADVLARHEVRVQSSSEELRPLVRAVIEENAGPVAQYRAGRAVTLGFLVGQVMKKSGGQAVPQRVQELLLEELQGNA